MSKKRHAAEEIVTNLRQVDVLTSQGRPVADAIHLRTPNDIIYFSRKRST
jgi:hypothetical protein